VYNQGV